MAVQTEQGIDIPDVRLVVCYGLPASVELLFQVRTFPFTRGPEGLSQVDIYQMFGRAGQDGQSATGIVLYRPASVKGKRVDKVTSLLTSKQCIRRSFCRLLDSPYNEDTQKDFQYCRYCEYDPADPYKFFVYGKKRGLSRKRAKSPVLRCEKRSTPCNLADRLVSWRQQEAESNGLSCVGHELVMSNALLSKVIDNVSTICCEEDLASIGVNSRFTTSLFQVMHAIETEREHDERQEFQEMTNNQS